MMLPPCLSSWNVLSLERLQIIIINNPWINDIQYIDLDHLLSLIVPLLSIFFCIVILPLYIIRSIIIRFLFSKITQTEHDNNSNKNNNNDTVDNNESYKQKRRNNAMCWLILLASICIRDHYGKNDGLYELIIGNDPLIEQVITKCNIVRRGPKPFFALSNRHIQFLPWMLQNIIHDGQIPYERINFTVTDCIDKSIINCKPDDSMNDTVTLDIFPSLHNNSNDQYHLPLDAPIIIFIPGLRCHSQDLPSNTIIRTVYNIGFRSIVMNRRGHTPNQLLNSPRFNIFGDINDLEQVYWYIKNILLPDNTPMFLHGISSGTATVVSALSEWDKRKQLFPNKPSPTFVSAVALTPGYDISKALLPTRFKWPYNPLMTMFVKNHFLIQNEKILRKYNITAYENAINSQSLQEFINASTPFAGYVTPELYYKYVNPVNDMHYISTPLYVINSVDDPCCTIENLYEISPYKQHNKLSYANIANQSKYCIIAVTKTGSHCPFLDGEFNNMIIKDPLYPNRYMINSWADQSIAEFYEATLQIFNHRRF